MIVKDHKEKDNIGPFISKLFMSDPEISTPEKCRQKLEQMFEERFKPDFDFLDRLQEKKDRCYE